MAQIIIVREEIKRGHYTSSYVYPCENAKVAKTLIEKKKADINKEWKELVNLNEGWTEEDDPGSYILRDEEYMHYYEIWMYSENIVSDAAQID